MAVEKCGLQISISQLKTRRAQKFRGSLHLLSITGCRHLKTPSIALGQDIGVSTLRADAISL